LTLSATAGGDGALSVNPDLAEEDVTMLCVTHEMGFARGVANQVIFMGQGQIVEQNSPLNSSTTGNASAPSCSSVRSCTRDYSPAF
jgi:ABC-type polar amino acid transport system ATPase subunit